MNGIGNPMPGERQLLDDARPRGSAPLATLHSFPAIGTRRDGFSPDAGDHARALPGCPVAAACTVRDGHSS